MASAFRFAFATLLVYAQVLRANAPIFSASSCRCDNGSLPFSGVSTKRPDGAKRRRWGRGVPVAGGDFVIWRVLL